MNGEAVGPRAAIVRTLQRLAALGLNRGTAGNVSVRGRGDEGGFHISPTGVACEALSPQQIVFVHWDGRHEGALLPSSEWRFHRDVLQARPEFNAIVHTHSPHATAVSVLGHDLPAVHYMVAAAGGHDIRCARYATFGTAELGVAILEALQGRRACLMAHHGVLAAHESLDKALALAVTVEEMAQLYLKVLPHPPLKVLPRDEMDRIVEKFKSYGQPQRGPAG
ncbi:MAG: class II aldolase/adducin family protein [Rubrivivax sp.]|nr:class II aldolase/adducin family protein [Rubrivivax sp.]